MTVTDQYLLEAARSALAKRLNGDAYDSYKTEEKEFVGMPIEKLFELIQNLENKIASDNGPTFIQGVP